LNGNYRSHKQRYNRNNTYGAQAQSLQLSKKLFPEKFVPARLLERPENQQAIFSEIFKKTQTAFFAKVMNARTPT